MEIKIASVSLFVLNAFFNFLTIVPLLLIGTANIDYRPLIWSGAAFYLLKCFYLIKNNGKDNKHGSE